MPRESRSGSEVGVKSMVSYPVQNPLTLLCRMAEALLRMSSSNFDFSMLRLPSRYNRTLPLASPYARGRLEPFEPVKNPSLHVRLSSVNPMDPDISRLVGVRPVGQNSYESLAFPAQMGTATDRAYGGCAIANAIHAACSDVDTSKYHLYSALGNFLGPALTGHKLMARVFPVRETRTFVTKRVELRQKFHDGSERMVMMVLADFQVAEPYLLNYSALPDRTYSKHEDCLTNDENSTRLEQSGQISDETAVVRRQAFNLMSAHFEERPCPESIWPQNLAGVIKEAKTSQDHLPIFSKISAIWYRGRNPSSLQSRADQFAALGFLMDHALSFIPLTHDHLFLDDSSACSSLDFALRFFKRGGEFDIGQWHLREMKTHQASEGRSYSEARIWNEAGEMLASMTQQGILRPGKNTAKQKL